MIAQNLRNLGYISNHKSNKGNCEQHNDFFCVFLNYPEGTVSPQYILPTVHIPQSLSQLCCSPKHMNMDRKKTLFPLYLSSVPLF